MSDDGTADRQVIAERMTVGLISTAPCTYCGVPVSGGPRAWHDAAGREVCPSGTSPTSFHEVQSGEASASSSGCGRGSGSA